MSHFDLHCHPTSKFTMTQLNIQQCPSPIGLLNFTIDPFKLNALAGILGSLITSIGGKQALEKLFGNPLDSQTSFTQIDGGSLIVVVLISIERAYTEINLFKTINELSETLFTQIKNRDQDNLISYHQSLLDRELAYINRFNKVAVNGRKFQIIKSINDYPQPPDSNTIYVILSVEGGHNFYTLPRQTEQEKEANMPSVVQALTAWKRSPQRPRLLYTTITHHAQNALANHPWAIPASFTKAFENSLQAGSFTPTGNGLTQAGFDFIDAALTESPQEKRVLIDVKHLSTVARNQAYNHIKTKFPGTPLLASHAGVTGMSWKDQPKRVDALLTDVNFPKTLFAQFDELTIRGFMRNDDAGHLVSLTFNGWSLNLFDEDIIEIIASGGLIGLQLDPRILGIKGTEVERLSKEEYQNEWPKLPILKKALGDIKDVYTFDPLPDFIFGGTNTDASLHRWHFCQTIIHIVLVITLEQVAGNAALAGVDPWEHICLGSDYDGLITAIKTAPTADRLRDLFSQETVDCLQAMASFLNKRNGNFNGHPLIVPFAVLAMLEQQNGINFLRKHFR